MDCNKDEAIRAKEIAVRKFSEKDVIGAAKFALKAQKLYPELEGISHLVANFELHMSAKFRRNGEIDWYRMLGVSPSADTDTITKQYRKMALLVHPDKNHEVGSESAFKLLSEAFRVLKDKTIRSVYDRRTNAQAFQHNFPSHAKIVPVVPTAAPQKRYSEAPDWSQFKKGVGTQSKNSGAKPSWNSSAQTAPSPNNTTFQQKGHTVGGCSGAPPRPVNKRVNQSDPEMSRSASTHENEERFWTRCSGCKMQFEYFLTCVNKHLQCPNCETAFQATEIPIPSIWQISDVCYSFSRHQNQKPSQIDGSTPSGALHVAGSGNKLSEKRSNQACVDADANNGVLENKRQKLDDGSKRKPKTGRADAKNK